MSTLRGGLLQVVYFSRNRIVKPLDELKWEIDKILEVSQVNNHRKGVTGALMFNQGMFAQVLEGPADAVEEAFERIQGDERHFDVTVLDLRPITTPSFQNWSMGFMGNDAVAAECFGALPEAAAPRPLPSGDAIFQTLRTLALRNELIHRAA